MKRKIIQIAAAGHANTSATQSDLTMFALCDDGTTWAIDSAKCQWLIFPEIPQPKQQDTDQ